MANKTEDNLSSIQKKRLAQAEAEKNPAYVFHDIVLIATIVSTYVILLFIGKDRHHADIDDD